MFNKLTHSVADVNSWLYYTVTIVIATIGHVLHNLDVAIVSVMTNVGEGHIINVGNAGKLFIWDIAVTDLLYAFVLLLTIFGALLKVFIDLSNYLYKRKMRLRRKEDPYE